MRTEWACSTASAPGHALGTKDKRGNWTTKEWAVVGTTVLEQRSASRGATDKAGAAALEKTDFTYVYGAGNQQLLRTASRPSVLDLGAAATAKRFYDPLSNRLEKVTFTGKTRTLAGVTVDRTVAVFYRNSSTACGTAQAPDTTFNRTLQVDGPCELATGTGDTAVACPSGVFPTTVYRYWPATESSFNRNRLQSITRSTDASCSVPLTVSFAGYDAFGNPGQVNDENGILTEYTFDADSQVLTKKVDGDATRVTSFIYDSGKRSAVRFPEGNGEVSCHRKGSGVGNDCGVGTGPTWTPQLQWIARKACSAGASWSCTGAWTERINFTHDANDGTLTQAEYRTCPSGSTCNSGSDGVVRRVEKFSADAHKRPTWGQQGDGAGSFARKMGFDGADNAVGIGHAWNAPPDFCRTGAALSPLCAQLGYDRADRLAVFDDFPTTTTGRRSCFDYDPHGNVSKVSTGCSTTSDACANQNTTRPDAFGTATTCDPSASDYVHDDFGNVVEMKLANTDDGASGRGVARMEYDARGNVVGKQTEAQRAAGVSMRYTFDALDRQTRADQVVGGTATEQYAMEYDVSARRRPAAPSSLRAPSGGCGGCRTRWGRLGSSTTSRAR